MGKDPLATGFSQQIKGFGLLRLGCGDSRASDFLNEPETSKQSLHIGKEWVNRRGEKSNAGMIK
jgi:hypothetical protein